VFSVARQEVAAGVVERARHPEPHGGDGGAGDLFYLFFEFFENFSDNFVPIFSDQNLSCKLF
jgi:hypothetical protein